MQYLYLPIFLDNFKIEVPIFKLYGVKKKKKNINAFKRFMKSVPIKNVIILLIFYVVIKVLYIVLIK